MCEFVGDPSSSTVALVVTGCFSYSHLLTIISVWSCSIMLGTQEGEQEQRIKFKENRMLLFFKFCLILENM